jgi:hypothetical protein
MVKEDGEKRNQVQVNLLMSILVNISTIKNVVRESSNGRVEIHTKDSIKKMRGMAMGK